MNIKKGKYNDYFIIVFVINLIIAILSIFISILIALHTDASRISYLVYVHFLMYGFYFDGLSACFLILNSLVFFLCILYSYVVKVESYIKYSLLLFIIHMLLFFAFSTNSFLMFYVFFELLLIPMFLLLVGWGGRSRRVHAAHIFFFFTSVSSVFLILGLIVIYSCFGTFSLVNFKLGGFLLDYDSSCIVLWLFFLGFMTKIPTMPFHIWLPEAHAEAPTAGSVLLAAIVLKLGYYGLFRVLPICNTESLQLCSSSFSCILLFSVLVGSCMTLRQTDLKKIIAYSSVVHMNFGLMGLFAGNTEGLYGSIFTMFSHGLISGGMFFCVGFLYDRCHSRNMMEFGGLVQYVPIFAILFFGYMLSNMSFPGTSNFIAEFFIYLSYGGQSIILGLLLLSTIPVSLFCFHTVTKIFFYQFMCLLKGDLRDMSLDEFFVLIILYILIIVLGVCPSLILQTFLPLSIFF